MAWLEAFFGESGQHAQKRRDDDRVTDDYSDEETVEVVRSRLERQAQRIAVLDAQISAQRRNE